MSEISPIDRPASQFTTRALFLLTAAIAVSMLPMVFWGQKGLPATVLLVVFSCLVWRKQGGVGAGIYSGALFSVLLVVSIMPLAQAGWWGLPITIPLAGFSCWALARQKGLVGGIVLVMAMIMVLFALMGSYVNHSARTVQCLNQMKQFGLAIENYHQANGHYPPPYTTDKDGNPLHSWRVLLLPYLDQQQLFSEFDLTKPWHHPKNLALADRKPRVYDCFYHESKRKGTSVTTPYVAILGDHTAWPRSGMRIAKDLVDGASNTLLLIESEKHRIHWMSTADPGLESLGPTGGDGETLLDQTHHKRGFLGVFCDGSVRVLERDYTFDDFLSLLTIDGDEEHVIPD